MFREIETLMFICVCLGAANLFVALRRRGCPVTRDEAVEIARLAAGGKNQPGYCDTPATFEPHEWVLDAIAIAFQRGVTAGAKNGSK